MFSNFLKKIATKGYVLFAQTSFDYVGEPNLKIETTTYDFAGNKAIFNWAEIKNDAQFIGLFGGYINVWIGARYKPWINCIDKEIRILFIPHCSNNHINSRFACIRMRMHAIFPLAKLSLNRSYIDNKLCFRH